VDGWNLYRMGDFTSAIAAFEKAEDAAGNNPLTRATAFYGLGVTWDLRRPNEDRAKAREYYQQAIQAAPESDVAAWSQLALARMEELRPIGETTTQEAARAAYQAVIEKYPGHPAAQEAFLYQQAMALATLDPESAKTALATLHHFLANNPSSKYASKAWKLMQAADTTLGRTSQEVEASFRGNETREIDPQNPNADLSAYYWWMATVCEFRLGDFEQAANYYQLLIREYPTDFRAFGSKQALSRMERVEAAVRSGAPVPEFPN
jgi:tetratricopeptide (TPR) repeat protein